MAAEKTNTEKIEYYYAWKGLEVPLNKSWDEVQPLFSKANPGSAPKFEYKAEAEAFCAGKLDNYIQEKHKPIDAAQYDAVIYADGGLDEINLIASYGLIIFFRGETNPYIESGTLKDVPGDNDHYTITKYDGAGNKTEDIGENPKTGAEIGYVSQSHQIAGELYGVMRAVEICSKGRGLKKLLIIYDCKDIKDTYDSRNKIADDDSISTVVFKKFWQNFADVDPDLIKVYSHTGDEKDKHQYPIDRNANPIRVNEDLIRPDEYLHAVYNDLVDALAKAEVRKPKPGKKDKKSLAPMQNFNLFRVISDEYKSFPAADANTPEKQREHARDLVNEVLNQSGGIYRPIFPKG